MVDRGVGQVLDGPVGAAAPAEQPHVAGPYEVAGLVEGDRAARHGRYGIRMRWWKVLGLAGLAGVAATGAVTLRAERRRQAYTPEEIRARLHERVAEARASGQ